MPSFWPWIVAVFNENKNGRRAFAVDGTSAARAGMAICSAVKAAPIKRPVLAKALRRETRFGFMAAFENRAASKGRVFDWTSIQIHRSFHFGLAGARTGR